MSLRRAIAVLLVLAAAAGTGEGVAQAASKPVVFGVGGWAFPTPATLKRLHHAGLRTWRLTMSWRDVSPTSSRTNFSGYDVVMRAAARNHIQMMVTLTGCPVWACPHGSPPVSRAALKGFRGFVRKAVRRYGHRGSVWRGHPRFAVVYWQVFNEVNGADQWPPRPRTKAYAHVLKATAWTIRHADRKAKIVLAGLWTDSWPMQSLTRPSRRRKAAKRRVAKGAPFAFRGRLRAWRSRFSL